MVPRGSSEIGSKGGWPSSDDLYFAALLCYFSLQPPTVSLLLASIPLLTPLGRKEQGQGPCPHSAPWLTHFVSS